MSATRGSIQLCEGCRQYYAECVCGTEYAPHGCTAQGCAAVLYYPDEGQACKEHTCAECGATVESLERFSLPWRDDRGRVSLDATETACLKCYAATMESMSLVGMLSVPYKGRA